MSKDFKTYLIKRCCAELSLIVSGDSDK